MKKIYKIILIIFICIAVLLISTYYSIAIYGNQVSVDSISIENVDVSGNTIKISGTNRYDSALAFSGYTAKLDNEQLIIKLRYSLVSSFNRYVNFEIAYNTKGKPVKKVIIKGSNGSKEIWTKE